MAFYQMTFEAKDTLATQLRDLFSTPKGTLILDPDYGMDYSLIDTDVGYALDATDFKMRIKDQISKYIPRMNAEKAKIVLKYHTGTGQLAVEVNDIFINLSETMGGIDIKRL